ncbi:hypothetical protein GCM10007416_33750 [Kroppenstedtia guangzhouensis]|uniref:Uncharacterized protein n=1 Tax=Kroppenstedtia guangzhouensis TaxID=1274356 RepID=A0ABQ1H5T4_9BACL|nr:hypothetical protein [Kroppenstedtia guangzhouensis]GGA57772.1 hypothetical protein GCM10007416_33750 [Kroppenstedtia guangzhouensis]
MSVTGRKQIGSDPGLRERQLWDADTGLARTFQDRELFYLELKKDKHLQAEERRKQKRSRKAYRKHHH